jgi:2-methylcitrate dehydratase PrpD
MTPKLAAGTPPSNSVALTAIALTSKGEKGPREIITSTAPMTDKLIAFVRRFDDDVLINILLWFH